MIKKMTILILLLGLMISCSSDDNDDNNVVKSATNEEGLIGLMDVNGIEKYTIITFIPGTIDGQLTGIVDNLPIELSTVGTKVIFTGTYIKTDDTASPRHGGQEIYYLTLSSIKKNE